MRMTIIRRTGPATPTGDADTGDVLIGKTFQSATAGPAAIGTMPNRGDINITPGTSDKTIDEGYYDGTGKVLSLGGDAAAGEVLAGKTFSSNTAGREIAGTMPNRGAVVITPGKTNKAIAAGYHNGSGYVEGDPNLEEGNIKLGVEIFGVEGTLTPSSPPSGNADVGDVIEGKTFESAVAGTGAVGTLKLTGTAAAGDVLTGKTFYNTDPKTQVTGTMTNRGAVVLTPGTTNKAIAAGYHNGSGYVKGDANLIAGNIKNGISIFGINGTLLEITDDVIYSRGTERILMVAGISSGNGSRLKEPDHLYIYVKNSGDYAYVTDTLINLTNVIEVIVLWECDGTAGIQTACCNISTSKTGGWTTYNARAMKDGPFPKTISRIDTSDLSGNYYIRVHSRTNSAGTSIVKVYLLILIIA